HAEAWRLVGLGKREGWAGHLGHHLAHERGDQGARKRGLAGPYLAAECNEVAAANFERQQIGEADDAGLIELARPFHHHARAASDVGSACAPASGKRTVTRVPWPGSDSSDMVPPCSSTRLLTMASPSPAPRCLEPWLRLSNRSSTRCCWSLGM